MTGVSCPSSPDPGITYSPSHNSGGYHKNDGSPTGGLDLKKSSLELSSCLFLKRRSSAAEFPLHLNFSSNLDDLDQPCLPDSSRTCKNLAGRTRPWRRDPQLNSSSNPGSRDRSVRLCSGRICNNLSALLGIRAARYPA